MSFARRLFQLLAYYPDELFASLCCLVVVLSCILMINHMPPTRRWIEKSFLCWLALGAFGGMVGPFCGAFIQPTWAELVLYSGVAVWAMWATWPFWHEL